MLYFFGIAGLAALVIGAGVIYLLIRDGQRTALQKQLIADYEAAWHYYQRGLDIMRRRAPNGEWQYRAMTDEEHHAHIVDPWG